MGGRLKKDTCMGGRLKTPMERYDGKSKYGPKKGSEVSVFVGFAHPSSRGMGRGVGRALMGYWWGLRQKFLFDFLDFEISLTRFFVLFHLPSDQ